MTTDSIKELVKRLREVFVEDRGHGHTTEWTRNLDGHEAADALEALAGEVERVKSQRDEYLQFWKNNAEACEAAEAERDRLKAALERLASCEAFSFSRLIGTPELNTRIEFARKALGGDA